MHFGPRKVVVLASHKTVKEALVGNAEQFGDRDVSPIFYDISQGHGTSIICTRATTTGEVVSISSLLGSGSGINTIQTLCLVKQGIRTIS